MEKGPRINGMRVAVLRFRDRNQRASDAAALFNDRPCGSELVRQDNVRSRENSEERNENDCGLPE